MANSAWSGNTAGLASATSSGLVGTSTQTFAGNKTFTGDIVPATPFCLRNKLINGGFDIWQRGTSQTTTEYGSDDRWRNVNIGSTKSHSRQAFALGQTDVPGNPQYFSRTTVTTVAAATSNCFKAQKVESVLTLNGQTATVSFWAKASTSKNICVTIYQIFGTGGSPSSATLIPTTIALTTSWARYTVTASVPSISGKTLGTDGNSALQIAFWYEAGSNFNADTNSLGQPANGTVTNYDIAQVQLEAGSSPTPFEQRPIGMELGLCQRYCFRISGVIAFASGFARVATAFVATIAHPVQMRTSPSVTSNCTTGVAYCNAEVGSSDVGSLAVAKAGGNNAGVNATSLSISNGSASMTVGQGGRAMLNNSVAYIDFDSEL